MNDDQDNIELSAVEDHNGILTIRGGGARRDWNGIHYKQGMSAKNVGTTKLSANIATIPPGGVAYAHIPVGFEVILYIVEGKVRHEFGPGLKQVLENEAGDFIYIKPGVPHEVFNLSDTEPVVAFVAGVAYAAANGAGGNVGRWVIVLAAAALALWLVAMAFRALR